MILFNYYYYYMRGGSKCSKSSKTSFCMRKCEYLMQNDFLNRNSEQNV